MHEVIIMAFNAQHFTIMRGMGPQLPSLSLPALFVCVRMSIATAMPFLSLAKNDCADENFSLCLCFHLI